VYTLTERTTDFASLFLSLDDGRKKSYLKKNKHILHENVIPLGTLHELLYEEKLT
jgi:hypothetical protein